MKSATKVSGEGNVRNKTTETATKKISHPFPGQKYFSGKSQCHVPAGAGGVDEENLKNVYLMQ